MKTSPVHFYVQRNASYSLFYNSGAVIPWELARLNMGNAMNLTTGIFTAPKDGLYHFDFSGYSQANTLVASLRLNGVNVGKTHDSDVGSIHSTLLLKKGDQIDMWLHC